MPEFRAPKGSEARLARVGQRIETLGRLAVWDVTKRQLDSWLTRFDGPDERFLATCLLERLVFRSRAQVLAGLVGLVRGPIRWALGTQLVPGQHDNDLVELLRRHPKSPIRFVPVIRTDQPPTKSSLLLLRELQRALRAHDAWFVWPEQALKLLRVGDISTVVMIDDLLGTGGQLDRFLEESELGAVSGARFIYAALMAVEDARADLQRDRPNLSLITAETIHSRHQFFSKETWDGLTDGTVNATDALHFYENWAACRLSASSIPPLGFGKLALSIGFWHATPNNSLGAYWQDSLLGDALLRR